MRIPLLTTAGLTAAALLTASLSAFAQQAPTTFPAPTTEALATPVTTVDASVRPRTLLKIGTGLTDGSGWGGYSGLTLPLVLGAEQQLAPVGHAERLQPLEYRPTAQPELLHP